jgi:hypothetical protein
MDSWSTRKKPIQQNQDSRVVGQPAELLYESSHNGSFQYFNNIVTEITFNIE